MKKIIYILCAVFMLNFSISAQEKTEEELIEAINNRKSPEWFDNAKLGIFVHWGLYSVPAYGGKESYAEWFLRGIQLKDSLRTNFMKKLYGEDFKYNDLTNHFKAELFNPDEWAELFENAGAKYVVLVTKHHDGYTLWPSKYNRNWNSVDTGPKRDIVGELTNAVRKTDLKMGLYYSLAEWNHPLHRWYTDPHDNIGKYVDEYMIPQFKELVSEYKPSLIFTDGEWYNTAKQWHSAELINWYYNLVGKDAIVNDRWGHGIDVGFLTPEYSAGIKVTDRPWAEVRGIGRSFGLNRNEDLAAYGTSKDLITRFVQTVANGGGMILNVGPRADGQIPMIQQERLTQLGDWLKINGAAIYGAKPFEIMEEEKLIYKDRVDDNINFKWVRNAPLKGIKEDNFTAEWKGFIVAPENGKYTFEVKADDEAAVFIDNKLVLNQDSSIIANEAEVMGANTGASKDGTITLKKGVTYPIHIKYKEYKQNAEISLFWSAKNLAKEIVPVTNFFQDKEKTTPGILGTYSSMETYLCYTQNNNSIYAISFEWPDTELVLTIPNPGKDSKVKLLGVDKNLDWKYENGKMHINTTSIKFSELPSFDAWTFEINKN
jgi:alpha-L-fucosidase